jgi:hypothetical protein
MKKISFLKKLFLLLCVLFAKNNITGSNYGISQEEINAIEEMMQDPEVLKDMYSQILNSSPQERKEIAKYMGLSDDDMDQFIQGIQQEFNAIENMNNNSQNSFQSSNSKDKPSETYTKPTISTAKIKEDFTKLINSISNIIKILTNIYQQYSLETRYIIKVFTLMNNYLSIAQHNLPKEIETFPSDFITYYQEKLFPIEQKIKSVTFIKNNIPNIYSEILNIPLNSTIEEINETIQSIIEESKKSTSQIKKSSLSEKEKRKKINSESVTLENIFEKLEIMGYDREKNLISQKSLDRYNEKLRDQFNQEIENKNYIQQFLNEIKESLEELSTNPHKSTLDELLKSSNSQISAKIEEYNKQAQQTLAQIISQKASSSVIDIDPEAQRRAYNSSYQDYNPYGSSYNSSYGNNYDYNDNYNQQEPFNDKNDSSNEKKSSGGGGSSSSNKKTKDEPEIKSSSLRNSNSSSRYNEPQESAKKNNESEKTEELNSPLITFTENLKQLEILFNNLENTQKFNDKKNILISIDKLNKEIDSTFNEIKEIDFQPNEQTSIEDIINILKSLTTKIESSKTDTDNAIIARITQATLLNLKKYLTHFDAKLNELKELQTTKSLLQKIISNMNDDQKFYLEFDSENESHIEKLKSLKSEEEYNKITGEISSAIKRDEDFKKYSENTKNKVIAKIREVLKKNKTTIEKLSDYYKNIDETNQDSKVSVEKEKIKEVTKEEKDLSAIIKNSNKIIDEIKEPEIQKKVKEELNKIIIKNITNAEKTQENKSSSEEIIAIIKNSDKASFKTLIDAIKSSSKEVLNPLPILDAYFDLKTLKSIDELKEEKIADEVKKIVTFLTTNLKLENKENKDEPFTIALTEILTSFVKRTKENADLEKTTKENIKNTAIENFLRDNSALFTLPEKSAGFWNNLKNQFTSNEYKDGAVYLYHMIIATLENDNKKELVYSSKINIPSKNEQKDDVNAYSRFINNVIGYFTDFTKNLPSKFTKEDLENYLKEFYTTNQYIKPEKN